MSASVNDRITDVRNAARPNSARVTSGRSAGGATLACDNLSGWPTASKVHFVTYKVDSNSAVVAGSQLDCYGIVSGNNIGSFAVVDGNDTGHAVGDVVEMLPTAAWGQDLADALTTGHTRTGAHVANLPLTTPILTTPTIADFTNAVHTHANNAGGGQLGATALSTSAIKLGAISDVTANQTITSGAGNTALTGFSLTVTVPAGGRDVQVFAIIPTLGTATVAAWTATLWSGSVGGTQLQSFSGKMEDSADNAFVSFMFRHTPSAGSITYLVSVAATAANVTATMSASAPGQMWANNA